MERCRLVTIESLKDAEREIRRVGSDERAIPLMAPKALHLAVRMEGLGFAVCNVLKQCALAIGAEAAVSKGVIDGSVTRSDLLFFGTVRQAMLMAEKMRQQPFHLGPLAAELERLAALAGGHHEPTLHLKSRTLPLASRTHVMGVLNCTPDSFSDGGLYIEPSLAIERALQMVEEGADIVDVGGESSRPGSEPVPAEEEIRRTVPVIQGILRQNNDVLISIDTTKSGVARVALAAGAQMVNDISGLGTDPEMPTVAAEADAGLVISHIKGSPRDMQDNPTYDDVVSEILKYLRERVKRATEAGVRLDSIAIDPGIGFGKTVEHNLTILRNLRTMVSIGRPILVGPSRKSFIGEILNLPPHERLEGTAAAVAVCILNGVHIVRVHDVAAMVRVARVADAIVRAA